MPLIGTAGHVDHGKSTLIRRITGRDPDRWDEEKRRGLTIDLGFAWTGLPSGATVAFVDVPGHVRFIKNMLAGVGAVDACLFVVAATEGWKPQSEEHLRILHGLRVLVDSRVVVDAPLEILEPALRVGTFAQCLCEQHPGADPRGVPQVLAVHQLQRAPRFDLGGRTVVQVEQAPATHGGHHPGEERVPGVPRVPFRAVQEPDGLVRLAPAAGRRRQAGCGGRGRPADRDRHARRR